MKKTLIILFCLISVGYFSFSQVNPHIVDTAKTWAALDNGTVTLTFKFQGDTIINGNEYKQLYVTGANPETNARWYPKAPLREMNGKVYLYNKHKERDELLYDFNLSVGDTASVFNELHLKNPLKNPHYTEWEVVHTDSVEIAGTLLKRIHLEIVSWKKSSDKNDDYGYDYNAAQGWWIEGIGSCYGPVYSGWYIPGFYFDLLCVHQNGVQIYDNPYYSKCYINNQGIEDNENTNINLYPTIVQDYLTIKSKHYPLHISVADLTGRICINQTITSDTQLSCHNLTSGLYILTMRGTEENNTNISRKFVKK